MSSITHYLCLWIRLFLIIVAVKWFFGLGNIEHSTASICRDHILASFIKQSNSFIEYIPYFYRDAVTIPYLCLWIRLFLIIVGVKWFFGLGNIEHSTASICRDHILASFIKQSNSFIEYIPYFYRDAVTIPYVWDRNYVCIKIWDMITDPWPKINGSAALEGNDNLMPQKISI